jgi:hypothetical protein
MGAVTPAVTWLSALSALIPCVNKTLNSSAASHSRRSGPVEERARSMLEAEAVTMP